MKMVDDLSYVGLLLHLLSDVPLEGDLAGVVFLLAGLLEQGADPAGDALLVSQCLLEDLDDTAEVRGRRRDGLQLPGPAGSR